MKPKQRAVIRPRPMADATILESPSSPADTRHGSAEKPDCGQAPFGTHTLTPWREKLRAFGAGLVPRTYPRLASIVNWPIWRASLVGRPGPVDLEPFTDFRVRLYPRENHADSKCYARPALCDLPEESAIARSAANTPDKRFVVVDVGANTGTYSILAASLAARAGKTPQLTCIEANPKTQARLSANLHFSGLDDIVRIVPNAVSDAPGTVMLDTATWNLGSVKVTQNANPLKGHKVFNVPARTLLAIVEDAGLERIDFLKIDIEGHEIQALGPFLKSAPMHLLPRMILAETKHDRNNQLQSLILSANYRITLRGRSDTIFEI